MLTQEQCKKLCESLDVQVKRLMALATTQVSDLPLQAQKLTIVKRWKSEGGVKIMSTKKNRAFYLLFWEGSDRLTVLKKRGGLWEFAIGMGIPK